MRTILLLVLLALWVSGCGDTAEEKAKKAAPDDFIFVRMLKIPHMQEAFILKDKETGILYLYTSRWRQGGLTRYYEKEER